MHILILGAYCSCNLGDAVICDCVAAWLRGAYPDAQIEIKDVVNRKRIGPGQIPSLRELERRRVKAGLRILATRLGADLTARRENRRIRENRAHLDAVCAGDYDAVVFAGGQMFMDGYGAFLAYCTQRFAERNIPVFFNGCGTGPAYSRAVTRQLGEALRLPNVRLISCRDNAALAEQRYKPFLPVLHTADPALEASEIYGMQASKNADTVGLGVLYPNNISPKSALKFWRGVIDELDRRGQKWQLFSNGDPADIAFARQILEDRKCREGQIHVCDRAPEALLNTIAGYKALISFRLHSHIIAASLDIPTVAVVWDEKLPFFFEKIGCPGRCVTVNSDAAQVLSALEQAQTGGYDRMHLHRLCADARAQLLAALEKEGVL